MYSQRNCSDQTITLLIQFFYTTIVAPANCQKDLSSKIHWFFEKLETLFKTWNSRIRLKNSWFKIRIYSSMWKIEIKWLLRLGRRCSQTEPQLVIEAEGLVRQFGLVCPVDWNQFQRPVARKRMKGAAPSAGVSKFPDRRSPQKGFCPCSS